MKAAEVLAVKEREMAVTLSSLSYSPRGNYRGKTLPCCGSGKVEVGDIWPFLPPGVRRRNLRGRPLQLLRITNEEPCTEPQIRIEALTVDNNEKKK